ncbi:UNVERIFIED_CONTAM: hypothetical protein K2H54_020568 [Gekko kuhli]
MLSGQQCVLSPLPPTTMGLEGERRTVTLVVIHTAKPGIRAHSPTKHMSDLHLRQKHPRNEALHSLEATRKALEEIAHVLEKEEEAQCQDFEAQRLLHNKFWLTLDSASE